MDGRLGNQLLEKCVFEVLLYA